jgi:hypothetical protein
MTLSVGPQAVSPATTAAFSKRARPSTSLA